MNKSNGTIISPDTPTSCGFKRRCMWVIQAHSKTCVKLIFRTFRLRPHQCEREFVEVKDGANSSSTVLGRYCGNSKPREILSSGRALFIRFKYNTSTDLTVYGFVATYIQTTNCTTIAVDRSSNPQTPLVMTDIPGTMYFQLWNMYFS